MFSPDGPSRPSNTDGLPRPTRDEVQKIISGSEGASLGVIFAFRRAPDGSFSFPFACPVFEQAYGVSPGELARDPSPVLRSIHAEDADRVLASIAESAERLTEWHAEFKVHTPVRGEMWLEGRAVPRRDNDGGILWCGFFNGVTARKRAELEAKRSRELLEAFIDHAPIGIAMFNRNLHYIRSSRLWQSVMATSDAVLAGRHHYDDFPELPAKWIDAHRRGLAGETVQGEDDWVRPDGKVARHTWEVHPWGDDGVDSGGIIILFDDVTEARAMEAELRHAHKMEALGQLAGGVAHDFNNLLQVIQGYAEMLQDQLGGDDNTGKYTREILKAAKGASSLTRQLLAFSRKQVLTPAVIDLNDVVQATSKMLKRLLSEDIDYRLDLAPGLWRVEADADQLSQVLINLSVNARDAMPHGGSLTITTRCQSVGEGGLAGYSKLKPGDYVVLTVHDSGAGMDAEVIEHIFEPFFTTKETGKGTGLGLSTVYGIVRQSDGYVWAESKPGEGTRVTVCLPRTNKHGAASATVFTGRELHGSETLLLVEDDENVRNTVAEYLPTLGYKVLTAHPSHALALLAQNAGVIDLLITDVVMPGVSGPVLAEKALTVRAGLPTLFMSGYIDDAVTRHGVLESKAPFLQKPFTLSELAVAIREALARV